MEGNDPRRSKIKSARYRRDDETKTSPKNKMRQLA
jgi:hypothetical protein